ncbi:hypothetical protein C5C31_11155 [Rathayibacter rathayi]|uniref:BPL-N domain-containing protein n=1 Tax=Rathayibacter rathayi TaxID=33887 RepID=UPI000CE83F29|nr:BPL-N domain-containing protein [Rathayibacter rathayi]PPG68410.1 hypothetical protein C5C02_08015 [Rathayibacter rathayi]PPG74978.1 hypothetical protein C5C23_11455 [Rathayibacter rathayi]PPG88776.1 hypothetical protein C5C47_06485 [Rathayibacter rathayi]PPG95242.1 hypothetical protein C5C00_10675 [Rathayibacter rathayi]PPH20649.1 hypothetical protein C5C31_11155 [Rathayibacter rathayi]
MTSDTPRTPHRSRPTRRTLLLGGGFAATGLLALGAGLAVAGAKERPLALVYDGPQGCDDCAPTIATVLKDSPRGYRVEYVGPGTGTALTAAALARAELYVQPGGGSDLDGVWSDLEPIADDLREWVQNGGSYLGLCFGAYLAGSEPGFDLLPGDAFGWAGSEGSTVPDDRDTVIPVTWRGDTRHVYFQDGPGFTIDDSADVDVLATYSDGTPAVLVAAYGKGRVGVAGPHPEADRSWYTEKGLSNSDGYSMDLAQDLIAATGR